MAFIELYLMQREGYFGLFSQPKGRSRRWNNLGEMAGVVDFLFVGRGASAALTARALEGAGFLAGQRVLFVDPDPKSRYPGRNSGRIVKI
jgi:hypothetical protein